MDFALEDNLDVIDITMILFFEGGDFSLKNNVFHIVEEEDEEYVQQVSSSKLLSLCSVQNVRVANRN